MIRVDNTTRQSNDIKFIAHIKTGRKTKKSKNKNKTRGLYGSSYLESIDKTETFQLLFNTI